MRVLKLTCLAVAAMFAIPSVASAGGRRKVDPEKRTYCIALVVVLDGSKHLEALGLSDVRTRQKKLMDEYQRIFNAWERGLAAFKSDPANRGTRYSERPPIRPQVKRLTPRSIRGKTAADKELAVWQEKWLKPLLAKEEAARKAKEEAAAKVRARADRARARAGGNPGARPGRPAGGGGGGAGRGKGGAVPPSGNLVKNGGFEEGRSEGGLTRFWVAGQWGAPGKRYSVRVCKTDSHGGDYSIAIRAFAEDAKPGAFTTLNVPKGNYQVSYWACCDVGKIAIVGATLARKPLRERQVGEDWKQFKQKIALPKDSQNASLRIWIETCGVRVFIDDVEVRPVK